MKQSVMGNTFARWIVKGLLVLLLAVLGAGLAHSAHTGQMSTVSHDGRQWE